MQSKHPNGLTAKAAQALVRVFGESPRDLQAAFDAHTQITSRPPTMAEMTNYRQHGVLRGLAGQNPDVASALQQRVQDAAAATVGRPQRGSNAQRTS
jgi:hypothetical protein